MNREIYRKIAKKYGVTEEEVRREMREAIDEAYRNPNSVALDIPRKGNVPTIEEFMAHIAFLVDVRHI